MQKRRNFGGYYVMFVFGTSMVSALLLVPCMLLSAAASFVSLSGDLVFRLTWAVVSLFGGYFVFKEVVTNILRAESTRTEQDRSGLESTVKIVDNEQ